MCLTLFIKKIPKEFYSCSCYFYIEFSTFIDDFVLIIDVVIDVNGVLVELMPLV